MQQYTIYLSTILPLMAMSIEQNPWPYWGQDKMADILQKTFAK